MSNLIQVIDSKECVGNSLVKINSNFSALDGAIGELQNNASIVPIGGIIMYFGSIDNFDENGRGKSTSDVYHYGLCNGNSYGDIISPNLKNRFVVGAGGKYDVGETGGEASHTLTVNELPSHKHSIQGYGVDSANRSAKVIIDDDRATYPNPTSSETLAAGGGDAHNNMPPYYALTFIIRIE